MVHEPGDHPFGLQIVVAIVVVRFIAHRGVEAFHDAVRFRVPRLGFDFNQVMCLDYRGNVAVDELAAMIVHNPGFDAFYCLQGRLQLGGDRSAVQQ